MDSTSNATWHSLPTEMKFTVVDNLSYADLKSLSRLDSATYHSCVPALFHTVHLKNYDAIHRFINSVPSSYRRHIRHLDLCMLLGNHRPSLPDQADALVSLLTCCSRLQKLVLGMAGSMDNAILSAFPHIPHLQELAISNCLPEDDAPVSERLVVHIAASLPNLHTLTLDRISRSALHSPDILYSYPPIPRVSNDDNVPPHPLLGSQLNLPSLLLLPSLKNLSIKDTHLGDPQWDQPAHRIACDLQRLDLGGSIHESEDKNGAAVERILKVAGSNIVELTLSTSLPDPSESGIVDNNSIPPHHPGLFRNLQVLRISPHFPIEYLEETLAHFSGSPIHTVSYECFDMDAVEVCQALEDFLSVRVCRAGPPVLGAVTTTTSVTSTTTASTTASTITASASSTTIKGENGARGDEAYYYDCLRKVEVAVVVQSDEWQGVSELWKKKQEEMLCVGVIKLVRYCRDLGLVGVVFRRRGPSEQEEWDLEEEDENCCWDVSEPGTDVEVLLQSQLTIP
ncbi:hypothetical protein F5887DRAFT_1136339 [Amanita rubescens]|nr:hypothetical protein F5887DRAFT_1136339 [Amanita rubescens]